MGAILFHEKYRWTFSILSFVFSVETNKPLCVKIRPSILTQSIVMKVLDTHLHERGKIIYKKCVDTTNNIFYMEKISSLGVKVTQQNSKDRT